MRRHFSFAALARPHRGNVLIAAAAIFSLGLASGAILKPPRDALSLQPARAAMTANLSTPRRLDPALTYPAEVLRVIDGDTFEARVRVWPGLEVDTRVRLRGIDAAELHARCAAELSQAQAARDALERILAEGGVAVSQVGIDKYGGRVDAAVSTRGTADVSAALLNGGFARSYQGGHRAGWC